MSDAPGHTGAGSPTLDDLAAAGSELYESIMCAPPPEATSLFTSLAVRRVAFGEVWSRTGTTRSEKRLVALTCVVAADEREEIDTHVYAALRSGDLSVGELQEAVLHIAVYIGWSKAARLDASLVAQWERVQREDGEEPQPLPTPWELPVGTTTALRDERGVTVFEQVMTFPAPPPVTPYTTVGVRGFVFGELWDRPGLTRKQRRFITLAAVCVSDAIGPIEAHIYAALNSDDLTIGEALELPLLCAIYAGWPKGSAFESTLFVQWGKIQAERAGTTGHGDGG